MKNIEMNTFVSGTSALQMPSSAKGDQPAHVARIIDFPLREEPTSKTSNVHRLNRIEGVPLGMLTRLQSAVAIAFGAVASFAILML